MYLLTSTTASAYIWGGISVELTMVAIFSLKEEEEEEEKEKKVSQTDIGEAIFLPHLVREVIGTGITPLS
jgi:hypothetical protein